MLETIYLQNSVRSWLIAAGILLGSLILGRVVSAVVRALGARSSAPILKSVTAEIGGPITLLAVLFGFRIASESLALAAGVRSIIANGVVLSTILSFTWLAANVYDAVHKSVFVPYARRPGAAIDLHIFSVIRTIVNVLIWMIGAASGLNSIGFEVSAILAGLGIGGMALALASQDTVANFFGGVLILTQRPFKVGERIEVNGVNGWVHQLGLRHTIVKNWYGREVQIPNKKFTDSVVVNIDSQQVYYQEVRLRLAADTTVVELEHALQLLSELVKEGALLDRTSWIAFDRIDHGFFEIEFWYAIQKWAPAEAEQVPNEYEKICRGKTWVNLEILKRFQAAGLRLALPIQAYVAQAPGALAAPPPALAAHRP